MNKSIFKLGATFSLLASVAFSTSAIAQDAGDMGGGMGGGMGGQQPAEALPLGFFITSEGTGNGADLGGLAGADAHCQQLAEAVGAGDREWRAFLSTQADGNTPAVNAIERIGSGPWANVNGVTIGANVEGLLYDNSNINHEYALTEKGEKVGSRAMGDDVVKHDILTGSTLQGMAYPAGEDKTCNNWTSSGEGTAAVGHSDRHRGTTPGSPWTSAHDSAGCSQEQLQSTGGDGMFYCFAAD